MKIKYCPNKAIPADLLRRRLNCNVSQKEKVPYMKQMEYEQSLQFYRFFHDYRMKILNYTIAFNAAMLVIVVQHIDKLNGQIALSLFSILVTSVLLGFEIRTINFANKIWDIAKNKEEKLELTLMSEFSEYADNNGIPQRYFVWAIYLIIGVVWL